MRPESIRRFDMFYLGSVALSVVDFILEYDAVVAQMESQSQAARVSLGVGFIDGAFAVWIAFMMLLWFLAAHRRSNIAKWLIVLLAVIGLWGLPALVTGGFTTAKIVSLLSFMLTWVAVYFLFRSDAKAWFEKSPSPEPAAPLAED